MDLDIRAEEVEAAIAARGNGRATVPFAASFDRELTQADLARLEVEQGIKAPALKKIHDSHHGLAKCLAAGKTNAECQLITGFSASRISILKNDPAFKELLEFYRANETMVETQVLDRLSSLSLDAIEMLRDRMHDEPDDVKTRELLDIATVGLDRTGYGPTSKMDVRTLTLTPEDMEKLARGARDKNVTVIEARPKSTGPSVGQLTQQISLAEGEAEGQPRPRHGAREGGGPGAIIEVSTLDTEVRPMATVHGPDRNELCAAGPLPDPSSDDPPGGVQT